MSLDNALERPLTSDAEITAAEPGMTALRSFEGLKVPVISTTPDYRAHDITGISFEQLHTVHGVDTLVLDVDQTLTETGSDKIHPEFLESLKQGREAGYFKDIYIATDSREPRTDITDPLDAIRIPTPKVLRKFSYSYWSNLQRRLMQDGHDPHTVAVVGDSRWDIRDPNALGLVTVAVDPLGPYAAIEHIVGKTALDARWRKGLERIGRESQPPLRPLTPIPSTI